MDRHAPEVVAGVDISGIVEARRQCVSGEPQDRISSWFTNPTLMDARLQGHAAAMTGDRDGS